MIREYFNNILPTVYKKSIIFASETHDIYKKMKRQQIRQSIRQALQAVPIPMDVRLYGSEARGDARPDSDIDLLILVHQPAVTAQDEDAIFSPLYQIELQTGVLINPLIMPKEKWGQHVTSFYMNVENEGIRLFPPELGKFTAVCSQNAQQAIMTISLRMT